MDSVYRLWMGTIEDSVVGEHLYTYIDPPNEKHLKRIAYLLSSGCILALPMGSSWAFCCDASSRKGVLGMYALKPDHPKNRPFSLICSDISMASNMANIGPQSYRLLKKAWPGGYTFILKSSRQLPKRLKDRRENVGIRIPNEEITLEIIRYSGKPLAATTVPRGRNGELLQMGYQVFDEFGHALALVVDIGNELSGKETTIIDLSSGAVELVREGIGDLGILGI